MSPQRIVIVGAGGFAREIRWLLEQINAASTRWAFAGFVVSDLGRLGERDSRAGVVGDLSWLEEHRRAIQAVAIGIGDPKARVALAAEVRRRCPELEFPALIHPSVLFDRPSCRVGEGVAWCAGSIGTVNLELGAHCLINLSCTIGHEARLGVGCVLNPTVNVSGGVVLGDRVLVGTGAQILQYVEVGDDAVVGAGAVVNRNVGAGVTVVGVPARPLERP